MMSKSSGIIKNTKIAGNKVSSKGGGIYIEYSDVSLSKLVISYNEAYAYGGGIYIHGTIYSMSIVTCICPHYQIYMSQIYLIIFSHFIF